MRKLIDAIKSKLEGKKTYLAAIGLVGLAVYQGSTGQYTQAVQTALAALTAFGLRQAVAKNGFDL